MGGLRRTPPPSNAPATEPSSSLMEPHFNNHTLDSNSTDPENSNGTIFINNSTQSMEHQQASLDNAENILNLNYNDENNVNKSESNRRVTRRMVAMDKTLQQSKSILSESNSTGDYISASFKNHDPTPKRKKRDDDGNGIFFGDNFNVERIFSQIDEKVNTLVSAFNSNIRVVKSLQSNIDQIKSDNINFMKEIVELKSISSQMFEEIKLFKSTAARAATPAKLSEHIILHKDTEHATNNNLITAKENFSEALPNHSTNYAAIVKQNHVVVITPKAKDCNSESTMEAIQQNISPTNLMISGVKKTSKGGVVINCGSSQAQAVLQQDANHKLKADYNVIIPTKQLPKVRVYGLKQHLPKDDIIRRLRAQNADIFAENATITVFSIKKALNSERFVFKMEIDSQSFSNITKSGKLRIGWDLCPCNEIVDVLRCFNCCRYHHTAKNCSNVAVCGKCSGLHNSKDCIAEDNDLKCSNCVIANNELHLFLKTDHCVWDPSCEVYRQKLQKTKARIDYQSIRERVGDRVA